MATAPEHYPNYRKPRDPSRRIGVLRALLPFLRPYRGLLAAAILALLAAALVSLALPLAVRQVIDTSRTETFANLDRYFVAALCVAGVMATATAMRQLLIFRLSEKVTVDIRTAVFDHVIEMSPAFYEKVMTGEIVSRLTTDTMLIQSAFQHVFATLLRSALVLSCGSLLLLLTSAKLTGMFVLIVPVIAVPILLLGRKIRRVSRETQDWIAASSGNASESLGAVQTVQSFTHEPTTKAHFAKFTRGSFKSAEKRNSLRALLSFLVTALTFSSVAVVVWIGGRDVQSGDMTIGSLVQFIIYSMMVAGAGSALVQLWAELQRIAGATERLIQLLQTQDSVVDPVRPQRLEAGAKGHIKFENVKFNYPSRPDDAALNDISFDIQPGETVALVGPSGAGKSTVIQLIQRFFDPSSGRVALDGHDLRDLTRAEFRRALAVVPQDPIIFAASAIENIRFGNPTASDDSVMIAAKAASAHDFISALPNEYATFLGERGVMLSGGQKQRVAIARAILRDAPILLLDEATSALDAQSERAVQHAIEFLSKDRTTIIIAHRLATVKNADRIIVMDAGQIVAMGTHEELVAEDALYARLARLQFTDGTAAG